MKRNVVWMYSRSCDAGCDPGYTGQLSLSATTESTKPFMTKHVVDTKQDHRIRDDRFTTLSLTCSLSGQSLLNLG
jgi:hypothetical protein